MKITKKYLKNHNQNIVSLDFTQYSKKDISELEERRIIYKSPSKFSPYKLNLRDVDKLDIVTDAYKNLRILATLKSGDKEHALKLYVTI